MPRCSAFKSPLSRGVLLADEVGLGKTIEAGLVVAQKWAERKRRILVITPSNLRKQWHQELTDKFFLPCRILESKSYNAAIKAGQFRPFEIDDQVVICSYQFARNKAADVHHTRLGCCSDGRSPSAAQRLQAVERDREHAEAGLAGRAETSPDSDAACRTRLLELFGLVSVIDDQVFGDLKSFREQFMNLTQQEVFATLQASAGTGLSSHAASSGDRVHLVHAPAAARRAVHAG